MALISLRLPGEIFRRGTGQAPLGKCPSGQCPEDTQRQKSDVLKFLGAPGTLQCTYFITVEWNLESSGILLSRRFYRDAVDFGFVPKTRGWKVLVCPWDGLFCGDGLESGFWPAGLVPGLCRVFCRI
jgi:hypothetical protein